jgi:hypothetical protein
MFPLILIYFVISAECHPNVDVINRNSAYLLILSGTENFHQVEEPAVYYIKTEYLGFFSLSLVSCVKKNTIFVFDWIQKYNTLL